VFAQVDQVELVPDGILREIDDDVVAFAMPCSSSSNSVTGFGNRFPSLAI